MSRPTRILFVAPWMLSALRPRPYQFASLLAEGHEVHYLLMTWEGRDELDARALKGASVTTVRMSKWFGIIRAAFALVTSKSLQQAFVSSQKFKDAIRKAEEELKPDVVILNVTRTSHFVSALRSKTARVLDLDEFRSEFYRQTVRESRSFITRLVGRLEGPRMARAEARAMREYDLVLVSSPTDVPRGSTKVRNIKGGSLLELADARPPASSGTIELLFSGRMSYSANIEAIVWFCKEVLPGVLAKLPGARLTIVGEDPAQAVLDLRSPKVTVVGRVPDMTPFFVKADVVLVPIRMATGVQQKLIGGLASGRLTICTTRVAELAGVQDHQHVLIADTAAEWIEAVTSVSTTDYRTLVTNGQQWVIDNYSVEAVKHQLEQVVAKAIAIRMG